MARLGWLGIVVPEEYGGAGLGWTELMVVLEELGRGLAPEPLLATVLLGATTLLLGGSEAQQQAQLPAVVAGERCLALAYQEPASRYAHQHVATRAERAGGGWPLGGEKMHVLDGHVADCVRRLRAHRGRAARRGGITLFLVPRDAPRASRVERQHRVDAPRRRARALDGVARRRRTRSSARRRAAAPLLERVLDRATDRALPPRCSAGWRRASR